MLTTSCRRLVAFSLRTLTLSNILSSGPSARALVDTEVNATRKPNGHLNWPFWEGGGDKCEPNSTYQCQACIRTSLC